MVSVCLIVTNSNAYVVQPNYDGLKNNTILRQFPVILEVIFWEQPFNSEGYGFNPPKLFYEIKISGHCFL